MKNRNKPQWDHEKWRRAMPYILLVPNIFFSQNPTYSWVQHFLPFYRLVQFLSPSHYTFRPHYTNSKMCHPLLHVQKLSTRLLPPTGWCCAHAINYSPSLTARPHQKWPGVRPTINLSISLHPTKQVHNFSAYMYPIRFAPFDISKTNCPLSEPFDLVCLYEKVSSADVVRMKMNSYESERNMWALVVI